MALSFPSAPGCGWPTSIAAAGKVVNAVCGQRWIGDDIYYCQHCTIKVQKTRIEDLEVAVAQAVEFATYVEQAAKGSMIERARLFMSADFAKDLAARLRPMLIREHRGSLDEAMRTVEAIPSDIASVRDYLKRRCGLHDATAAIEVAPYGRDDRIGWDVHIVLVNGHPWAWTNKAVPSD